MVNTPTRVNPEMSYEGFAAEDLEKDSVVLKVICPELSPQATQGTVGAGITTGTVKLKNRDGGVINTPIASSNHIVATWGGSSNMRYPPMIRKGEPVKLYTVANQDKFYWKATGKGREFRTTDRVHFEVGASPPDKPGQEKDDSNTYSAYLDSDAKKVGFKTSQANGEVAAFSMEANLEKGTFHLSDNNPNVKNRIFLDTGSVSGVPVIQLNLSSGATIKMQGEDVFIKVPKKLLIDVGDRFVINSPLTIFNLSKTGTVIINAVDVTINAAKSLVTAAASIGLNGATKVGGVLKASQAKVSNLVKGAVSGEYSGASVSRPEEGPVTNSSNSPDTDMTGPNYTVPSKTATDISYRLNQNGNEDNPAGFLKQAAAVTSLGTSVNQSLDKAFLKINSLGNAADSLELADPLKLGDRTSAASVLAGSIWNDLSKKSPQYAPSSGEKRSIPTVVEGTAAPTTTPDYVGQIFIDTSAKIVYVSVGTSGASDWIAVN